MATARNLLQKSFTAMHAGVYRASKGRVAGKFGAAKILVLTTTGRKTGRPRSTPLNYFADGDRVVLIASNGGSDHHPSWYLNVVANPDVTIQRGAESTPMHARIASPEEKAELWPRITAWYKGYASYQAKTARDIPLVIVEA